MHNYLARAFREAADLPRVPVPVRLAARLPACLAGSTSRLSFVGGRNKNSRERAGKSERENAEIFSSPRLRACDFYGCA